MEVPETRYAKSGDVHLAYQVVGEGPIDLVLVHGWVCTFHAAWERPQIASFYERLASMGRLVLFDKRGTGLSDRVHGVAPLEERMDDVRAVMDAVGSERAVIFGVSEGGSMSALFAATHPERTAALVLTGTFARSRWAPDYPFGMREEGYRARLHLYDEEWPEGVTREWLARVAPAVAGDDVAVAWYVSWVMRGASPGAAAELLLMNREIDVRHVLPTICVPTLTLYRRDEQHAGATRFMGESIPGAEVVELEGDDHLPWEGDQEALVAAIERFLARIRADVELERVLATVLFTDIVASTAKAAELGDRAWRELLERHHRVVRSQLARFRGREVATAGDGFLATFDGPARAVRCACTIAASVRALGLEVRAGVHTGETEIVDRNISGIAVHIGARVADLADPGEVLVSSTVKDLVAGSGLDFRARGAVALAGVPDEWSLYSAVCAS